MKLNRLFASMLILAATASVSFSQVAASISWNACTGPVDLAVTGGLPVNAFVSVLGHSQVAQAYQCVTIGGSASGGLRDAWRFDPTGCEGSSFFTLNHLAPGAVSKTCPSFQGALPSLPLKDLSFVLADGKARLTL